MYSLIYKIIFLIFTSINIKAGNKTHIHHDWSHILSFQDKNLIINKNNSVLLSCSLTLTYWIRVKVPSYYYVHYKFNRIAAVYGYRIWKLSLSKVWNSFPVTNKRKYVPKDTTSSFKILIYEESKNMRNIGAVCSIC